MNVLLDESTPELWAAYLTEAGHPAQHRCARGGGGAADPLVLAWARERDQVLLTCDTDVGPRRWFARADGPTVIQLGSPTWLPATHGAVVVAALAACESRRPQRYLIRIYAAGGHFKLTGLPLR